MEMRVLISRPISSMALFLSIHSTLSSIGPVNESGLDGAHDFNSTIVRRLNVFSFGIISERADK